MSCDQVQSGEAPVSFWEEKKAEQARRRQELTEQYGTTEEDFGFWEQAKLEVAYTTQPHIGELVTQAGILSVREDRVVIGVEQKQDWLQLQHPRIQEAINRALSDVAEKPMSLVIELIEWTF